MVGYVPATGRWRTRGTAPCSIPYGSYAQTAWLGDRYVTACGRTFLQIYDPAKDRWTVIRAGRSPLNSRSSSAIAWTGHELIAWSGTVAKSGNPTPADGASILLPR